VSDELSAVCFTAEDAHAAARQAYAVARSIIANGENALIECRQALEPVSIKQRRFLHGVVLKQISEQVRVEGHRYVIETWKRYFVDILLPQEWEMVEVPPKWDPEEKKLIPPKRERMPKKKRTSTEELGVRAYSEFTEKVIDYAAVEWGVEFQFTNEEQLLRTKPKAAHV
jgi:hypothetical protein